jgi:type II secretory pathway predicted ATPase ExeA/septal ring-binding cell division protein DamX
MSSAAYLPDPAEGDSVPPGDPFQADCGAAFYFDEAVRAKRLNLLLHLVPYSDVLLVTGEAGSGKSCVLRRLLAGVPDSWRVCHLQATATLDDERLRELLRKEFSLRPDDGQGDGDQYLRLLRESLYALRHSALIPVLAVDDAHLLTQPALALLTALTEPWQGRDKLLSVVLFAEPSISKKLIAPGLETLRARISHTFDLPPLSEDDTGKYIQHRLSVAGVNVDGEGTPFTPSVIKFIHVASRGLPGRINEFARVVLQNSAQRADGVETSTSNGRGRIYIKYGVAALLILSLAIGLVLYHDRLFGLVASLRPGTSSPPAATTPAAVQPSPPTGEDTAQSAAIGGPTTAEAPVAAMSDTSTIADEPAASSEVSRQETEASPSPPPVTVIPPAPPVAAAPDNAAAMTAAGPANAVSPPASAGGAQPTVATGQSAMVTEGEPSAGDSATVKSAPAAETAEPPRDDTWLLAQDPASYTLQLLVASRAQCLAYIERYGLGDAAAIFQTRSGGQPYFALVYGVYATEVDAADAGKALSDQDVKISPWVRRMGMIQARIQEFQSTAGSAAMAATDEAANNKAAKAVAVANINNKGVTAPGDLRHESWLLEQPPETYTLQLFTGQQANVLAYLKRHALADKVAVFHPADGSERLTVVYGIYPNASQALQAGKELAVQLPDVKPWARSLREIQAIITPQAPADNPPP